MWIFEMIWNDVIVFYLETLRSLSLAVVGVTVMRLIGREQQYKRFIVQHNWQ